MKKLLLFVGTISVWLSSLFAFSVPARGENSVLNFVQNGSFEGETRGKPDEWTWYVSGGAEATSSVVTTEARFGKSSLKITNNTVDTGNVFGRLSQAVKVKPNTTYTLSCWVKGVKVLGIYWTNWEGWSLEVPNGTYDWKRIETTFTTGNDQTETALGLNTANIAEALYLDGVQFEEGPQANPFQEEKSVSLKIKTNASTVNNIFNSGEEVRIIFEVYGRDPGSNMEIEYGVEDFFSQTIVNERKKILVSEDGTFSYTTNLREVSNGVFDISARLISEDRETVKETYSTFSVIPVKKNTGLVRDSPFGLTFAIPELAQQIGVKWNRLDAYWDDIEPGKGEFNFNVMDEHLRRANKHGIELFAIIDYSASWASSASDDIPSPERCMYPPEDVDNWRNYVTTLVKRYKGKIKAWEIWNEVNAFDTFFKTGSVEKYVELLESACTAIKQIDPEAKVVGCATSTIDLDFIEKVFEAGGFRYMDAVSVHPYRGIRGPEETRIEEEIAELKALIEKYGGGKELWNTEFGWWANDFQPDFAEKGLAITERQQANYLATSYIIFLSSGFKKIFWFTHRHHVKDFRDSVDAGIGLLYHDYKMKPAAVAYRTVSDELEATEPVSNRRIGDSIQVHLFKRSKDKKEILALWSWKETDLVAVESAGKHISVVDLMNNRREINTMGNPVLLPLEEGSPVFIEGENLLVAGPIIEIEIENTTIKPQETAKVLVTLNNLLLRKLSGSIEIETSHALKVSPRRKRFNLGIGRVKTYEFKVRLISEPEYGLNELFFTVNIPGMLEKPAEIRKEFQVVPANSIDIDDFETDISSWKPNTHEAHVVYNKIEKSDDSVKEGEFSLHWMCKSPGRWNTITKDVSNTDLTGAKQIIFWLYMPHPQKGGTQGMGIEVVEKDGSRYYHSEPMIPLYPVGKWNLSIIDLKDFYLPSFSEDENEKLDPEQIKDLIFNLTGGEFNVYLDGVKITKNK